MKWFLGLTRFDYNAYLCDVMHDSAAQPEERQLAVRELRLRSDTLLTLALILALTFFLALAASMSEWASTRPPAPGTNSFSSTQPCRAGANVGLVLTCALAAFAAGSLVGFLFGIPRTAAEPSPKPVGRRSLLPNTNLEQISDWLTKIIVGVGLVEARQISGGVFALSTFMADSGSGIHSPALAAAVLVGFAIQGFFIGYLGTRMFLSPAFSVADDFVQGALAKSAPDLLDATVAPVDKAGSEPASPAAFGPAAVSQAKAVLRRTMTTRIDAPFEERYVRAKSLLAVGQYQAAAIEYAPLVAEKPTDTKIRRERLWALFKRGPHWGPDIAGTLRALYDLRNIAPEVAEDYLSLTFHYLYSPEPRDWQRVIDLVHEYELVKSRPGVAGLYINVACAYGLMAKSRLNLETNANVKDLAEPAAAAITTAVALNPNALDRLRQLLNPKTEDNDLAAFHDDPSVRTALKL